MENTYLSDVDLARRFCVSRITVWRWSKQGILPKPIPIGPNCTRWRGDEVEAAEQSWLAARAAKAQVGEDLTPHPSAEV